MLNKDINGVPNFFEYNFSKKMNKYCLLIVTINEKGRIEKELETAQKFNITKYVDIIICDGGSTDGSTEKKQLKKFNVRALLVTEKFEKYTQSKALKAGFWWALEQGYEGVLTVDGNNKDSIEDVYKITEKLDNGYDFIQASRFIKGGKAVKTPFIRYLAIKFIHAPLISLKAKYKFTDTTNLFRGYSKKYLTNDKVKPFRDIFRSYELPTYLVARASELGMKVCEVPVARRYPSRFKFSSKMKMEGNIRVLKIIIKNLFGKYDV